MVDKTKAQDRVICETTHYKAALKPEKHEGIMMGSRVETKKSCDTKIDLRIIVFNASSEPNYSSLLIHRLLTRRKSAISKPVAFLVGWLESQVFLPMNNIVAHGRVRRHSTEKTFPDRIMHLQIKQA